MSRDGGVERRIFGRNSDRKRASESGVILELPMLTELTANLYGVQRVEDSQWVQLVTHKPSRGGFCWFGLNSRLIVNFCCKPFTQRKAVSPFFSPSGYL